MIHIVWRFRAKQERLADFLACYGVQGKWFQLFARSRSYRATQLWRDAADELTFVTIDSWTSEAGFSKFQTQFAAEYQELDRYCEGLTEAEEKIGVFAADVDAEL